MICRTIGRTGLQVTALAYGTWKTFGETVERCEEIC